jgi:hypothetical protein
MSKMQTIVGTIVLSLLIASAAPAQQTQMTFFVTSVGSGNGANLGGLAGADKQCQTLAAAVGAGNRTWRAYLSTQGPNAVSARDRIGQGPWVNAKGVRIAANVAELHSANNNITAETALTEKGGSPTRHDMLTGSQMNGMAFADGMDHTCNNWTGSTTGSASLGHHDRRGLSDTEQARSWNSSHPSKGCSQENLRSTGGDGLFYCFAQ